MDFVIKDSGDSSWYVLNKERAAANGKRWAAANRLKKRAYQRAASKKRRLAIQAIKLKAGCIDCGYCEHPAALDFDHRPLEIKLFSVGTTPNGRWEQVLREIAKCDVVCANCHRVRTEDRRSSIVI